MYEKQQAPVPLLPCFISISVILSVCFPLNVECGCSRSPVIFNMGDSNSDTGGFYSGLGIIMPPPEGRAFFHKFAGRLSDGRLIIDFLCELFTFTSLPFSCFFVFLGVQREYCFLTGYESPPTPTNLLQKKSHNFFFSFFFNCIIHSNFFFN